MDNKGFEFEFEFEYDRMAINEVRESGSVEDEDNWSQYEPWGTPYASCEGGKDELFSTVMDSYLPVRWSKSMEVQ